nr:MAG TPA: hypothetical protein [Microviridae sp.]
MLKKCRKFGYFKYSIYICSVQLKYLYYDKKRNYERCVNYPCSCYCRCT